MGLLRSWSDDVSWCLSLDTSLRNHWMCVVNCSGDELVGALSPLLESLGEAGAETG